MSLLFLWVQLLQLFLLFLLVLWVQVLQLSLLFLLYLLSLLSLWVQLQDKYRQSNRNYTLYLQQEQQEQGMRLEHLIH